MSHQSIFIFLLAVIPHLSFSQYAIEVKSINDHLFIYTSYVDYNGHKIGANGLILDGGEKVIAVDATWNDEQTNRVIKWVKESINKPIDIFIVTHAHDDRIGGINTVKAQGIKTVSGLKTAEIAKNSSLTIPDYTFETDTTLVYRDLSIELYYPGAGHSPDNIVVHLPEDQILYGGCFLKNSKAKDLGNVADADLKAWPESITNIQNRFPYLQLVIPGHGDWSPGSIENTIKLLKK